MIFGLLGVVAHIGIPGDYTKDFDELLSDLDKYGAYTRQDSLEFGRLKSTYRPRLNSAASREEALKVFEDVLGELHDFHASLSTNNDASPKLVPSGTDIVAEWRRGKAIVAQVREGSPAEKLGVRYGDVIEKIGDRSPLDAAMAWLHGPKVSDRALDWGLNSAIAGRWNVPREFSLARGGRLIKLTVPTFRAPKTKNVLTINVRKDGIVVLRPENSLGEDDLAVEHDASGVGVGEAGERPQQRALA